MVFIVIMRNYFNFSRIMTQFASVSKNLPLVLVFSRLLGDISFPSVILGLHGWGGGGILLHRSVPGSGVPLRTTVHTAAVRIHLRRTYTVCSLYLTPGVPIARDDLVESLRQLSEPFFLVGDFNIFWGDMVASPTAAMLLSVVSDFSLLSELWSPY